MTRETIYAALYAKSSALLGFNTQRRRLKHWSDMNIEEFPALFQGQGEEHPSQGKGRPTVWTLRPKQYLYVHSGNDESLDPAQLLNPKLDILEGAFMPPLMVDQNRYVNTLGGLVEHCWIAGIEMMEGVLGPIEVAIVSFDILTLGSQ